MNSKPFAVSELDRLGHLLARFSGQGGMTLEQLDGFADRPDRLSPLYAKDWAQRSLSMWSSGKNFKQCCGKIVFH
jgi:hypothetical protein